MRFVHVGIPLRFPHRLSRPFANGAKGRGTAIHPPTAPAQYQVSSYGQSITIPHSRLCANIQTSWRRGSSDVLKSCACGSSLMFYEDRSSGLISTQTPQATPPRIPCAPQATIPSFQEFYL